MIDRLRIPLLVSARDTLAKCAMSTSDPADKAAIEEVALEIPPECHAKIDVSARQLLAAACDAMRAAGQYEMVAKLEALVKQLKKGRHAQIKASLNYRPGNTPGEVFAAAENLAKSLITLNGG